MSNTILKYKGVELVCYPNTINKYRDSKIGLDKVIVTDEIFISVQKGTRVGAAKLDEIFGTNDSKECLKIMLDKGDFPLTSEERKEIVEKRRLEIIHYIHSHYVDPKSNLPIPITRIENALTQMKIRIDHNSSLDKLLKPILKKLPEIIPVKKQESLSGVLRIPHKFIGQSYGIIGKYADIKSERYDKDVAIIEIGLVPSDYENLLSSLEKITSGEYQFETLN